MSEEVFKSVVLLFILLLLISIVILYFRPYVIVNYYFSDGNYTIDIGKNMIQLLNQTK